MRYLGTDVDEHPGGIYRAWVPRRGWLQAESLDGIQYLIREAKRR